LLCTGYEVRPVVTDYDMKQALQLRLGQHLTMTPQLQQAIKLLQLSTLELNAEIQDALDSNLMLEIDEGNDDASSAEAGNSETAEQQIANNTENSELNENQTMPDELPVDSSWDDIYENISTAPSQTNTDTDNRSFETPDSSGETLVEHLRWQMQLTHFSDTDVAIAEVIIDAVDDDGYLSISLQDIASALPQELDIEEDEIEAVLHRIQNFDPVGVAARTLQESLLIQLKQLAQDAPWLKQAQQLIENHFDLLANREYPQLIKRMKISEDDLKDIVQLIQSLNPRPGSQISNAKPEYIVPDVYVNKIKGQWQVELNPETAPRLRVNAHYVDLIKRGNNSEENNCLKDHLQEARWFIKSLLSRNETLLKVSNEIVKRQKDFLEYGEEAMKALVLHDIAEVVEMHESTISRVTTRKYMHTPRGIFELKYFFSSHVSTSTGGECSATAIRALIKKLIAAELPNKPLSDNKLANILEDQGINVARRTVAKYREAMAIPPSNERKRLA